MKTEIQKTLEKARSLLKAKKEKRLQDIAQGKNNTKPWGGNQNKGMTQEVQKKLRTWGVKSMDHLMKVDTSAKKYAYLPREDKEQLKCLKESVDIAVLCSKLFDIPVKETQFYEDELDYQLKAFGIVSGDEGFEWIPTAVSESFVDEFNLPRKVSGLFAEIRMPTNPFKFPVLSAGAIARQVAQATALANPQVFKTDKSILLEAKKLTAQYELPEELNEDSAPDIIRVIRQELIEGQEKAMEIAILEGDTTGAQHNFTQLPDESPTTTIASISAVTPETVFDGIRVRCLAAGAAATVDAGGNALTEAELSSARSKMGKFGVDPSQLALIPGPKVYNQMLQLDDVRTLEQFGPKATVLTGQLASYEGAPVVPSEYAREDTDTTGVNSSSAGNNIKGSLFLVNRKRWWVGNRRAIQILIEKNRTQIDALDMVSFSRKAFQAVLKADGSNYAQESSAALIFNIGL